jgi:hypothetical protein
MRERQAINRIRGDRCKVRLAAGVRQIAAPLLSVSTFAQMSGMLSQREAEAALEDAEVVPVAQAGVAEAKEIQAACLAAGVPALLGRDDHCVSGCAPKLFVLAREEDAAKISAVMQARWRDLAIKDGAAERIAGRTTGAAAMAEDPDAEPPCPACGLAAPLVDGACAECGLQLG